MARRPAPTRGSAAAWPAGCARRAPQDLTTNPSNRCSALRYARRTRRRARDPAIETRGLTKRYRRVTALSDCTITVPEGVISALVGPNGAGKTTLLRLLSGLASPTSGEAAILGGAPCQDPAFLAEIGFLAQEIPL